METLRCSRIQIVLLFTFIHMGSCATLKFTDPRPRRTEEQATGGHGAIATVVREALLISYKLDANVQAGSNVILTFRPTGGASDSISVRTVTLINTYGSAGTHSLFLPRLSKATTSDGVASITPTGNMGHYEVGDPTLPSAEATWRKPSQIDLVSGTRYSIELQATVSGQVVKVVHTDVLYRISCNNKEDCNNFGTCDVSTGTCLCNPTFYGDFCQFKRCPVVWYRSLSGQSTQYGSHNLGWVSEKHVQQGNELEPIECSGNGKCDRNTGRCLCHFRYTGAACELRHACPPSRSNNTQNIGGVPYEGADLPVLSIGQSKGKCRGSHAEMDSFHNRHLRHQLEHLRDPLHTTTVLAVRLAASRSIDAEGPGVLHDVLFAHHFDWDAHQHDMLSAQLEGTTEAMSCYSNFYGPECKYSRCAKGTHGLECSGNGLCNATTGKCHCFSRFYSPDCSRKRCPTLLGRVCNLQGVCRHGAGMQSVQALEEHIPSISPLSQPILSHDLVGTCACRYPYYGDTCQFRRCPNDTMTQLTCAGHGTCMPRTGNCLCQYGYYGHDCSRKQCPVFAGRVCNGQGMCISSNNAHHGSSGLVSTQHTLSLDGSEYGSFVDKQHLSLGKQGVCACRYPYFGPDCSSKHCPIDIHTNLNCSGHGSCDVSTGVCACDKGWYSTDCSFKTCPTHHGRVCNFHGKCRSSHGHVTRFSARSVSGYTQSTTHNDQTQFNYAALWRTDHHTSTYSVVNALENTQVAGFSITGDSNLLGTCQCEEPYFGESCAEKYCPIGERNVTCSGHGTCDTTLGVCVCKADYFTSDCSKKQCPLHDGMQCNNQGTCVHTTDHDHGFGTCECTYPYHGPACEFKHCPNSSHVLDDGHGSGLECDGRGTCDSITGKCVCQASYFGPDCTFAVCPMSSKNAQQQLLECNGEGKCDRASGMCKCHSTFFHGDACDLMHCPSTGGLECSEHGACNYHTGECRCDPGWKGSSCERLGSVNPSQAQFPSGLRNELSTHRAYSQAPELTMLESGDHHSVGSSDNIYYPTGQCRDHPSQQVNHTFFFNEAAGLDFSTTRSKTNCHTKHALNYEKCARCGNVPDQGSPGQIPPNLRCEGDCKGKASSSVWT